MLDQTDSTSEIYSLPYWKPCYDNKAGNRERVYQNYSENLIDEWHKIGGDTNFSKYCESKNIVYTVLDHDICFVFQSQEDMVAFILKYS